MYVMNSLLWPCSSYKPTKNSLFCCCCFIYCSKNQLLSGMIIFCGQLDLQAELRDDVVASSNIIRNKRNIIRSICQKMYPPCSHDARRKWKRKKAHCNALCSQCWPRRQPRNIKKPSRRKKSWRSRSSRGTKASLSSADALKYRDEIF